MDLILLVGHRFFSISVHSHEFPHEPFKDLFAKITPRAIISIDMINIIKVIKNIVIF